MVFVYQRQVHFGETDAAGVMYFVNALNICHEAYEASLLHFGFNLQQFFAHESIAVPIIHASIDYQHPCHCGDRLQIHLRPQLLSETEFEINYECYGTDTRKLNRAQTRHVSISKVERRRTPLRENLHQWIQKYNVD